MSKPLSKFIEKTLAINNLNNSATPEFVTYDQDFEQKVRDHLISHPDFFIRHREILLKLKLPQKNPQGELNTINLLDKHREVLEARVATLEYKYKNLVEIGKANQNLSDKIHRLICNLSKASTLSDLIAFLQAQCKSRINISTKIWLWHKSIDPNSTATFSRLPITDNYVIDFAHELLPLQIFYSEIPKYIVNQCKFTIALPLTINTIDQKDQVVGLLCFIDDNDVSKYFNAIEDEDFLLLGRFAEVCARLMESHIIRLN